MTSTAPPYTKELSLALRIVHAASLLTKSVLRSLQNNVSAETKADDSPVTIADFAAQAIIISALHGAFPSDHFLGEESADQLRKNANLADRVWDLVVQAQAAQAELSDVQHVQSEGTAPVPGHVGEGVGVGGKPTSLIFPKSKEEMLDIIDLGTGTQTAKGRVWVMDPVDGTATFMTGNQYAVCLCLLVDGIQQVAVIGCPNLPSPPFTNNTLSPQPIHEETVDKDGHGVILSAIKGKGTYIRKMKSTNLEIPHPIQHNLSHTKPPTALNFIESAVGSTSLSQTEHEAVASLLGTSWPGTTIWSQQMKYIALTLGATDAMLRLPKNKSRFTQVWDHAGGQLLFTEVGGVITDIDGEQVDFSQGRAIKGEVNYGMIAALPTVYEEVAKAVKTVLARRAD